MPKNTPIRIIDNAPRRAASFLGGGGAVTKLGDGLNVYSTVKDTASKNNLYFDAASSEYRLQNNTGSSRTYSIFSVRTRATS